MHARRLGTSWPSQSPNFAQVRRLRTALFTRIIFFVICSSAASGNGETRARTSRRKADLRAQYSHGLSTVVYLDFALHFHALASFVLPDLSDDLDLHEATLP